ncbi:Uncharacterised protein [Serratia proteamaculans]|nr:Uncharacterised protein [Serratia proteamaculans]
MIYYAAIFQVFAENPGNLSWPGSHQLAFSGILPTYH